MDQENYKPANNRFNISPKLIIWVLIAVFAVASRFINSLFALLIKINAF